MQRSGSGAPPEGRAADVAVVLGAAVWAQGRPSPTLWRRTMHAVELARSNTVAYLLLTGGVGRHPPAEAIVMRSIAERAGIEPGRLLLEETATTTLESARACARIIAAHRWTRVLIVTDRYHLARSLMAFRHFGVVARGSAAPDATDTAGWQSVLLHVRELVAIPWYLVRLAVEKK
jgi:vancomycin permeability regulator SanA